MCRWCGRGRLLRAAAVTAVLAAGVASAAQAAPRVSESPLSSADTTSPSGSKPVYLASPSGRIYCGMGSAGVSCTSSGPEHRVSLTPSGQLVDVCIHDTPTRGCGANFDEGAKFVTLAYGRSLTVGPFRCVSSVAGMTCVVAKSGRGFIINRAGVKAVGGQPSAAPSSPAPSAGALAFYSSIGNPINDPQLPNRPVVRPSGLLLFQDGSWFLKNLRWSGWGSSVAHATGTSSAKSPAGTYKNSPAQLTLSQPKVLFGHKVYSCYQLTIPATPAANQHECIAPGGGGLYLYQPVKP